MSLRIEDYALIGDCQTGALVGNDGSMDWLCLPRFDAGAVFAALLGDSKNGRWRIAPTEPIRSVRRQYLDDSLVLETLFETDSGQFALLDFMPVRDTVPDVIRIVEGRAGQVPIEMELIIRFDYGSIIPWVQNTDGSIRAIAGPNALRVRSPIPMQGQNLTTVSKFTIDKGQRVPFHLTWYRSFQKEPAIIDAEQALKETLAWWKEWSSRFTFEGPYRDLVLRSLITLKAMTYLPSGGIVAALTTSLPEHIGGVRNWDYRYCWLRDATLSLLALMHAGYTEEAAAWTQWLLRAVAGDPSQLQIMYGVGGERRLEEYELPWLGGFEASRPIRIGNAAHQQFQLDVYGELADAMHHARLGGLKADRADWRLESALIRFVEKSWDEPDEGIWEVRGPRRHFTHSKVMAWVAIDRAIKSAEKFHLEAPLDRWKKLRSAIHDRVCRDGFSSKRNAFVQSFESELLDASVLMIPQVGFLPPDDPRVRGTVAAIEKHLLRDGFVLRYDTSHTDDGLPPGEGAFLPCTFWLADCYALMGDHDKARDIFERLIQLRNDLDLISEEYDPHARRLLGNFPQAFTHLCLINTAFNLCQPDECPGLRRRTT